MTRPQNLVHYLRGQGVSQEAAEGAQQILAEWRNRRIPIWGEEDQRDERRAAIVLGKALSKETTVRFFAPTCPDYPADSHSVQLGVGLGETIPPVLSFVRRAIALLEEHRLPYEFTILVADTETDLAEVVQLLANSVGDFLERCKKTANAAQEAVESLAAVKVVLFSEYFAGQWHAMQYFWEEVVRGRLAEDPKFHVFLSELASMRRQKYERQLGRGCSQDDCLRMAIRHYAQYHALGFWMRGDDGSVLVNTNSPNLRAIRRPFVIEKMKHSFLPKVVDQNLRIPVVVLS